MELKDGERLDDLEVGGAHIIQNPSKYCFTSDAVLLANLVKVRSGDTVCDLGTGSGIIATLIAVKTKAKRVDGLELSPDFVDMARRSVKLNGLEDRLSIIEGDIKNIDGVLDKAAYDVVVSNPPYKRVGSGDKNLNEGIAMARHEITVTLKDVISAGAKLLRFSGRLAVIVKAERLAEVIYLMHEVKIEAKQIYMIRPKLDKDVDTVVVEGTLGGKAGLSISELVVYNEDGTMTERAKLLYNKK